jgi:hypothetical protein
MCNSLEVVLLIYAALFVKNGAGSTCFGAAPDAIDLDGSLDIVVENFKISCGSSDTPSYVQTLCDKVRRNMYSDFFQQGQGSTHNSLKQADAAVKANLLVELSPEFEAQIMRPSKMEKGVKYPVIFFAHGNYDLCGLVVDPPDCALAYRSQPPFNVSLPGGKFKYVRSHNLLYSLFGECSMEGLTLEKHFRYDEEVASADELAHTMNTIVNEFKKHANSGVYMTPHKGYRYIGETLAKRGYFVISMAGAKGITSSGPSFNSGQPVKGDYCTINCDQGDRGGYLAWARMGLATLELLQFWNKEGGSLKHLSVDLQGQLDMSEVGLMGHSRGGAAVAIMHDTLHTNNGSMAGGSVAGCSLRVVRNGRAAAICRTMGGGVDPMSPHCRLNCRVLDHRLRLAIGFWRYKGKCGSLFKGRRAATKGGIPLCKLRGVECSMNPKCDPTQDMSYPNPPKVGVKAVFAIAPIDVYNEVDIYKRSGLLDIAGTAFVALIPGCDADVWGLGGRCYYDRILSNYNAKGALPNKMKAIVTALGTSHDPITPIGRAKTSGPAVVRNRLPQISLVSIKV